MVLGAMPEYDDDDELDTRKPLILKITAVVVIIGLVVLIADLFFSLVLGRF